jgi:hypothetical protein
MATKYRFEPGADGKPQAVIPGTEVRVRYCGRTYRRQLPVQKPCDHGLFSDEADQLDLREMFMDE